MGQSRCEVITCLTAPEHVGSSERIGLESALRRKGTCSWLKQLKSLARRSMMRTDPSFSCQQQPCIHLVMGNYMAIELCRRSFAWEQNLCKIIHDLVESLFPLQMMSKDHENGMATIESALSKTTPQRLQSIEPAIATIQAFIGTVFGDKMSCC